MSFWRLALFALLALLALGRSPVAYRLEALSVPAVAHVARVKKAVPAVESPCALSAPERAGLAEHEPFAAVVATFDWPLTAGPGGRVDCTPHSAVAVWRAALPATARGPPVRVVSFASA
jgi:hypothetical protein